MKIHPDFSDFISALNQNNVDYILVGAFTLAFLGQPRLTGDMDIWIRPTEKNATFGLSSLNLKEEDIFLDKSSNKDTLL